MRSLLVVLAVVASGCRGGASRTPAPAAASSPPAAAPAPASSSARALQGGASGGADPAALAALLAAAAAAGLARMGPPQAGDPVQAGLDGEAGRYAPQMTPDAQVAHGTLAEGGHVGFLVQLDPHRCYTVVAHGAGELAELDATLLMPPLYNFIAAQDPTTGPTAVIGAAPQPYCPPAGTPFTVPYKVDLHASRGSGAVVARLFSRPR